METRCDKCKKEIEKMVYENFRKLREKWMRSDESKDAIMPPSKKDFIKRKDTIASVSFKIW